MADTTKPTLTYFPFHGKAMPIRMMLKHKGIDFEDKTVTFEQFAEMKAAGEVPAGQVPLWQENGRTVNQATAIMRHLGRQHGYYPQDDLVEAFNIDWCLETIADLWNPGHYRLFFNETADDADKCEAAIAAFTKFND